MLPLLIPATIALRIILYASLVIVASPIAIPIFFLIETSYYVRLKTYLEELDFKGFEYLVFREDKKLTIKNCSFHELKIREKIENDALKNDKKDSYLQTILLNRKIRDILSKGILLGVVGQEKNGKSNFVKEITDQNTVSNAHVKTKIIQFYRLIDSIHIIYYPDDGIQFDLSKYFLDHVFMVCQPIDEDMVDNKLLLNSIKRACINNFTIILNKINENLEEVRELNDLETQATQIKLKYSKEFETRNIFVSSLKSEFQSDEFDTIEKSSLVKAKQLKSIVYNIVLHKVEKSKNYENIMETLKHKLKI